MTVSFWPTANCIDEIRGFGAAELSRTLVVRRILEFAFARSAFGLAGIEDGRGLASLRAALGATFSLFTPPA